MTLHYGYEGYRCNACKKPLPASYWISKSHACGLGSIELTFEIVKKCLFCGEMQVIKRVKWHKNFDEIFKELEDL